MPKVVSCNSPGFNLNIFQNSLRSAAESVLNKGLYKLNKGLYTKTPLFNESDVIALKASKIPTVEGVEGKKYIKVATNRYGATEYGTVSEGTAVTHTVFHA